MYVGAGAAGVTFVRAADRSGGWAVVPQRQGYRDFERQDGRRQRGKGVVDHYACTHLRS